MLQSVLPTMLEDLTNALDIKHSGEFHGDVHYENEKQSLVGRFQGYYTLDGHNLDGFSEQFAAQGDQWQNPQGSSIFCKIAYASENVDETDKLVSSHDWYGTAAQAFKSNFLDPFQQKSAPAHGACAVDLAVAAKALADGVEHAKQCVVWICKQAILAAGGDADPGEAPGEEGEGGVKHTAGFAAVLTDAVALFTALVAPEKVGVDITLAGIGFACGLVAESKAPSNEQPMIVGLGTGTASDVISSTWAALNGLDSNITDLDDKIARGLGKDFDTKGGGPFADPYRQVGDPHLSTSAYSQLDLPGLARPTDSGHPPKNPDDLVVKNVTRLFYAGQTYLPGAALEYSTAANLCDGAHIDGIGHQFPQSVPEFNMAAGSLSGTFRSTAGILTRTGEALVTSATSYHETDLSEAAEIKKIEAAIQSHGAPGSSTTDPQQTWSWLAP